MKIKSVLLIDDDTDDHAIFSMAISEISESMFCAEAYNGEDALQKLRNMPAPDIIFMDINMPGMNGFDTLRELKSNKQWQHIPVIMYSTSDASRYKARATALGAVGYVKKPSSFEELREHLFSLLHSL
jgi:CheY-like chemotaxis protein